MARVLLADDGESIRRVIARGLTEAGHEVDQVSNGREALEAIGDGAYDIVITDMIMPEVGGADVISELLERCPGMKVVAISGGDMLEPEVYLRVAQEHGAVSCLMKPFMIDELVSEVDKLLSL